MKRRQTDDGFARFMFIDSLIDLAIVLLIAFLPKD